MKMKYNNICFNSQIWGIIAILSIIGIELLIDHANFVLHLSFDYLGFDNPITYGFYILFILLAMSIGINRKCIFPSKDLPQEPLRKKVILLIKNSCSGSVLDIFFLLVFFFYLAWLPDVCLDWARDGLPGWRIALYLLGLIATILVKPASRVMKSEVGIEDRTLLVTGMSDVKYSKFGNNVSANTDPIIELLDKYYKVNTVLILLSDQMLNNLDNIGKNVTEEECQSLFIDYKNNMKCWLDNMPALQKNGKIIMDQVYEDANDIIRRLILGLLNEKGKERNLNVIFTSPVDYNDFKKCNKRMYDALASLMEDSDGEFKDDNVIVNITAGPSIVAGVMTMNAIKGNRGLVYTEQSPLSNNSGKLAIGEYNPDIFMLEQSKDYVLEEIKDN